MKRSTFVLSLFALACIAGGIIYLSIVNLPVEQPVVIVNGSDGQRVDIVIGHDTIIISKAYGYSAWDNGFGNVYRFRDVSGSGKVMVYEDVSWFLVRRDAGYIVYVTGGS